METFETAERTNTHYPSYDVMALQDEWDSHTKEIVRKRLGPFPEAKFLTKHEEDMLMSIASHILYDNRRNIFEWVLHHIDQTLSTEIGESQRKPEIPPEKILVREGLKFFENIAQKKHRKSFLAIENQQQSQILADLQKGKVTEIPDWSKELQKALFNKLAELLVSAYYSHPIRWSEIGYGGPAYPRGYMRVEFGLADPWEAKKEDAAPFGFGEEGNESGE